MTRWRRKFNPAQVLEMAEYRKTHSAEDTGKRYNISAVMVWYYINRDKPKGKPKAKDARQIAKEAHERYYDGAACQRCPGRPTRRYTSSTACITCVSDNHTKVVNDKVVKKKPSEYSKEAGAISNSVYKPTRKAEWPPGVNFGGDNEYPDEHPYNFTHKAPRAIPFHRTGSAASLCADYA